MAPAPQRKIQVLIVEDVDTMRALLQHMIETIEGIAVSGSAENAWQARVELTRRRPDVVLLDEILPGESSVDLLADFVDYGVPVVLMTSVSNPVHGILPGALGRLIKPDWDTVDRERSFFEQAIRNAALQGCATTQK